MLLAWAAAALGVLTKGLVAAAIPAAVLVIYSVSTRDFAPWRKLQWVWGLPLFLIIAVPWHWLAASRLSDFLQFFFVHEHFARYLTPSADRQEPWWFFGWVFLAGTVPWTLPALTVVAIGWRARAEVPGTFNLRFFLWIWVVFICVFFSLSDSKLMPYILPAMPALAVLIGALPTETLKRDFLMTAVLTTARGSIAALREFQLAGGDRGVGSQRVLSAAGQRRCRRSRCYCWSPVSVRLGAGRARCHARRVVLGRGLVLGGTAAGQSRSAGWRRSIRASTLPPHCRPPSAMRRCTACAPTINP